MPNCPSAAFELCGDGEDSWESLALQGDPTSQSERKSILNIHWKDWCWSWNSNTLATYVKNWFIGKDPDAGKDWRHEEKGTTEYEMAGWYHRLKGHEFGWTPGAGDGQGGLACCSPWGCKQLDMTEWLNWTELKSRLLIRRLSGLPWWLSGKESACQCRRLGFDLWIGKIPRKRTW